MSMTDAEIREALARAERATPGPWFREDKPDPDIHSDDWTVCHQVCSGAGDARDTGEDNAEFIAHARTDVPRLVATIREREAEIERLTQERDELHGRLTAAVDRVIEIKGWHGKALEERDEARSELAAFPMACRHESPEIAAERVVREERRLMAARVARDNAQARAETAEARCAALSVALNRVRIMTTDDGGPCWCACEPHQTACAEARALLSPTPSPEATPVEAEPIDGPTHVVGNSCSCGKPTLPGPTLVAVKAHEEAKCATCGGKRMVCAVPDGYHHGCVNPAHAKPCPDCGGGA